MRFRKLALFISAVSAVSAGLIVVACGSDTTDTPVPTPTVDGSKGSSGSSGTSGTSGSSGGDDTGAPDAGADCESAPYLHAPPAAGADASFYCPFQDGGSACAPTDTCCDPGIPDGGTKYPSSFCAQGKQVGQAAQDMACATAATAVGSTYQAGFFSYSFQCDDSTGCPSGESCIAITSSFANAGEHVNVGPSTSKTIPKACNAKQLFQLSGTQCMMPPSILTQDQKLICTKDADCTTLVPGTTCVPASVSGRTLGVCTAP